MHFSLAGVVIGTAVFDGSWDRRWLPAVPTAAGRALAHPDDEADQPDHEDDQRDPPQDVDSEPEAAEYEGEKKDEKDNAHELFPFSRAIRSQHRLPSSPDSTPVAPSAISAGAGEADLDRTADLAYLEGGLRRGSGSPGH